MRYGYLTSGQLINLLFIVLGILVLLPIVCLIIRRRHAAARRDGHPPFSCWYVIVPHLLVILIFTGLTGLFAGYLQSYGKITMTNVSIVALFLFLLSARAFLRNRNLYTAVLSAFCLLATVCVSLLAFREPLLAYMNFDMTPFLIAVILCSVLAVLAFYVTPEMVRNIRRRR